MQPEQNPSMAAQPSPESDGGPGPRVIGLVADPGTPWSLVRRIARDFEAHLEGRLGRQRGWRVEIHQETLPVAADGGLVLEQPARDLADRRGWDTVIAVVDLPRFEEGRGVVADVVPQLRLAVVCLPALGVASPTRRLRETLLRVVEHLDALPDAAPPDAEMDVEGSAEDGDPGEPARDSETGAGTHADTGELAALAPLPDTTAGTSAQEGAWGRHRTSTVYVKGWVGSLRLLAGMVLANRPLRMPRDMTWSIAAASAAGAYGVFFGSIWVLSSVMSLWRLAVVMVLAILLLVVWLIVTNGLWTRGTRHRHSSRLDNLSTFVTVGIACTVVYVILFTTLGVVAGVIIPVEYLSDQLESPTGTGDYLRLVWLAASMGTMAGAVGSSFDDSERIRNATYSLRERHRRAAQDETSAEAAAEGVGTPAAPAAPRE